jgi:chorismate dehydratase
MLNVSIVSYLNTAPFMLGLNNSGLITEGLITLSRDIPSICAQKLMNGEVNLGLVPVAILPSLPYYQIIGNTCIGSVGKVDSVVLLSDVPLAEIETIVLDSESRTSVNLCRLLARDYWQINPNYIQASSKTLENVGGRTAGVLIGDRVFDHARRFNYVFDLSEQWQKWTGLPFVFAVWATSKSLNAIEVKRFESALQDGLHNIEFAIEEAKKTYPAHYPIENYLRNRISYKLDFDKRKGLETFLTKLSTLSHKVF